MSSAVDKNKASRPQNDTFHKVKLGEWGPADVSTEQGTRRLVFLTLAVTLAVNKGVGSSPVDKETPPALGEVRTQQWLMCPCMAPSVSDPLEGSTVSHWHMFCFST